MEREHKKEIERATNERLELYQRINEHPDTIKLKQDQGVKEVSIPQFTKLLEICSEWDISLGKEFERFVKNKHTIEGQEKLNKWWEKAKPLYKKLLRAQGIKVCKSPNCWIVIPPNESGDKRKDRKEYCTETCRKNKNSRDSYNNNKDNKKIPTLAPESRKRITKDLTEMGIEEQTVNALFEYVESQIRKK